MRKRRLLIPPSFPFGVYHVISRVVNRELVFGDEEKEKLTGWMRRYAEFGGLTVLTHCMMGNHFHILVEVPKKPDWADAMSDAALVGRVRKCQGKLTADALEAELVHLAKAAPARHEKLRARWIARMWDLSAFVQSVKQRFSVWFNRKHQRKGTLWEERFKSVLALGPQAVATMAAYIDLNPVRAGLVGEASEYVWSGYGEAVAGKKVAKEGIKAALCGRPGAMLPAKGVDALDWYAGWLGNARASKAKGAEASALRATGDESPKGYTPCEEGAVGEGVANEASALRVGGGESPKGYTPTNVAVAQLMERVRHFSEGLAVGAKGQLEEVFEKCRSLFGPRRKTGARRMRQGGPWGEMKSLRDLSK